VATLTLLVFAAQASAGNPPKFAPAAAQNTSAGGTAGTKDYWYIPKGSSCINGTRPVPGAYAKVSFLMYADAFPSTSVENFVLHARMIPRGQDSALQNWPRKWSTNLSASLIAGSQGHRLLMTTWARVPDTEKDWDLQVKLQWKRMSRVDWNKTLTIHFNEAACPQAAGGGVGVGLS
jgi:hypothetical protein